MNDEAKEEVQAYARNPSNAPKRQSGIEDGIPGPGRGKKTDYNINRFNGDSAEYLTARIARDRPDILERMKSGEYTSVRRAALDAGIVKPRISAHTNPLCRYSFNKYSELTIDTVWMYCRLMVIRCQRNHNSYSAPGGGPMHFTISITKSSSSNGFSKKRTFF